MRDIRQPLHLICDTREITPWAWEPSDAVVEFAGLAAGDYATREDCEKVKGRDTLAVRFSVERKEFNDFLSTISTGWERFQRELTRMENFPARCVIVEGSFDQCCFHQRDTPDQFGGMIDAPQHNHPMLTPAFVARRVAELTMQNVSVIFAGNAQMAACLALHIFRRRADLNSELRHV